LRNRWRPAAGCRARCRQEINAEEYPDDRPTGVGKTEIARRLARLADAPFIKVEATNHRVGYSGVDVDTIVRDLVEISVKQTREQAMKRVRTRAQEAAKSASRRLLPAPRGVGFQECGQRGKRHAPENSARNCAERRARREGNRARVAATSPQMEILAPPGMEELTRRSQGMLSNIGSGGAPAQMKSRSGACADPREEAARLSRRRAQGPRAGERRAERHRVPRRDRQDTSRSEMQGPTFRRQGVQRDLLPGGGTTVRRATAW